MTPAVIAHVDLALGEHARLQSWIETRRGLTAVVNGVEVPARHLFVLASDIGQRLGEIERLVAHFRAKLLVGASANAAAHGLAMHAASLAEMLRAALSSTELADPSGMRQAARRAYTVARMLRELVAMLDGAEAQQQCPSGAAP